MSPSFPSHIPKPTSTPTCSLFFFFALCLIAFYSTLNHNHPATTTNTTQKNPQNTLFYQDTFLSSASNYTISAYLHNLTLHPHLAGTPPSLRTALLVKNHFESLNLATHITNYTVLLSYPTEASLSAHFSNGSSFTFRLSELGSSQNGVVRPYHAYSPSGSAYGKAVFVNYGREADYRALAAVGVEVSGCVAVVRRGGGMSRNAVAEVAAEKGVAAVVMYTEGDRFREGVERGTVMKGLGDPLSPGWAGVENGEKLELENPKVSERFPKVPSMPVSAATAEAILRTLEWTKVPNEWRGTLNFTNVDRAGSGPTMLNFTYQGEKKLVTIYNVFAVIRGLAESDRFVLLGNHRDAWTYGAVDPNSGTAALLDIARRYSLLMRLGWNPQRTIILCSWDAEEFGMVGSTEWVEQNLMNLGSKAVAYLNVDCAVQGPGFFAGATPQLDDLIVMVTKKVKDADSEDVMLYEKWMGTNKGVDIHRLSGVDSDFAPFLQHAGVPSIDLYYGKDFPVYHTAFDSYKWMTIVGDPMFLRHVAVSGVWGLIGLHLADDPILPFNYLSYAAQLKEYTTVLGNFLEEGVSLSPVTAAIQELDTAAREAGEEAKKLRQQGTVGNLLVLKKRMLNDRLMFAERGFLDAEGLHGRQWFKHLIYGPCGDGETTFNFFPGIINAITQSRTMNKKERQTAIQHEVWRVARAVQRAACTLKDGSDFYPFEESRGGGVLERITQCCAPTTL